MNKLTEHKKKREGERYRIIISHVNDIRRTPKSFTLRPAIFIALATACMLGLVVFFIATVYLMADVSAISQAYEKTQTENATMKKDLIAKESVLDALRGNADLTSNALTVTYEQLEAIKEEMDVARAEEYDRGYYTALESLDLKPPEFVAGKVELVDWFKDGSSIYKRGTKAVLIDIATGLRFNVYRMGGDFHGDSEPLTKEDTDIFKQIVGEWTWDRRPMWLQIGNRYFAVSINCMPHLAQTIKDNNFNGHLCIHFYKSKVHETSAECPRHQTAVKYAYNFGNNID